jgi:hypothetical protein
MRALFRCGTFAATLIGASIATAQMLSPEWIATDANRRAASIAAATPAAPWGCVVLLCLANPQGPMTVPQCVEPIRRLFSLLRARQPFPSCPMSRGPSGGAIARLGSDYYDPCPVGTTPLPVGQLAYSDNVTTLTSASSSASTSLQLIDPVANVAPATGTTASEGASAAVPPRVCGAGPMGQRYFGSGESSYMADVYQRLVLLPAAPTPSYVEILLDVGDGRGLTTWTRTRF